MAISDGDIKKLWGLAAGRCSFPNCHQNCVLFLNPKDPTVIGEMAHIIAKSPDGPRGKTNDKNNNTYENLILLCPSHHTSIDKAVEGTYTIEMIQEWKKDHEEKVSLALDGKVYSSKEDLFKEISFLLIENHRLWKKCGPESEEARSNPISNLVNYWTLRKLDTIVPNNKKIVNLLLKNKVYLTSPEYEIVIKFKEHAEGFERNCYMKTEGISRFPDSFEILIKRYAEN
jgi:hypothetical protein